MNAGGNKFNAFCQGGGDKKGGLAPFPSKTRGFSYYMEILLYILTMVYWIWLIRYLKRK